MARYNNMQNFDVKQMYPNIMIYERLSPDKDREIIPKILNNLKVMRVKLKKKYQETGSKADYITQYNYKVLANIFYGAYANPSCRFFDGVIASAITQKGRHLLNSIKVMCEDLGFKVVYGDTDSVFVIIEKNKVPILEKHINRIIKPYEIEAGEFYKSILYTGDETGGNKKRYAGIQEDGSLKIVGLEAIKRDYCVLSRETQMWALHRILSGGSLDSIQKGLRSLFKGMLSKVYDPYLVITKSAKKLEDYKIRTRGGKVGRGLPHIRALRKSHDMGIAQGFDISFVYTKTDVEPVIEDQPIPKNIDYELYFDRQIRGVVDPLIKAIQVQNGTYQSGRGRRKRTINESLFDHISS